MVGIFITFEGLDGAGKSTQIQRVRQRLEDSGQTVVCTREPGGTKLGESIREILLNPASVIGPEAEALLYAASRAELVREVIRPALGEGKIVISDRYVDASLAYQGAGLGLGVKRVQSVNSFATGGLEPNLTFLFDLPVETSQERVTKDRGAQGKEPDRLERRSQEYFTLVREQFLDIAKANPKRVHVVNASLPLDQLEMVIWKRVMDLMRGNSSAYNKARDS